MSSAIEYPVHLAISSDVRGFGINATLIASILRRTGRAVWVRCWCRGFLPESFETGRLRVEFRPAVDGVTGRFPGYVGAAVFDRLRVIGECEDWDRCLVMDYDQVALCDIAPLFDMDLGDSLLAAKMQGAGVDMEYAMRHYVRKPFPQGWEHTAPYPYFSMGPLLNLKAMREANTWEKLLAAHAAFGVDEQLSLTAATEGRTVGFDRKWNLFPKSDIRDDEVPVGVVHWLGWPKPWHKDAKVWRPDIWEAERATWEHLRMGIWEKPLAIEVEPDDPREVRALLERGWRVVVGVGRQTEGKTRCESQESRDKNPETREDSAFSLAVPGAATLSRARLQGETEGKTQDCKIQDAREDLAFPVAGSGQAGAGAGRSGDGLEQDAPATLRPPLRAEDLGSVGFPDLVVREGGCGLLEEVLASDAADRVRIGPWTDAEDWLDGISALPEYLVMSGGTDSARLAALGRLGYREECRIRPGEWPAGGPLPRVLDYGPLEADAPLKGGEAIYLKRDSATVADSAAFAGVTRGRRQPPPGAGKVGVLVIATAKYRRYVRPLLASIRKNFLPSREVTVFLFTDGDFSEEPGLRVIPVEHATWPGMTIRRHAIFREHAECFAEMEHLFYLDADMRVIDTVGEEILGDLVAVLHPGFHDQPRERFTYERRAESTARIQPWEGTSYYCAALLGGSRETFLAAVNRMAEQIDADNARGITAVWHDESHWNRYLVDHPPTIELSPSYCWYPDGRSTAFEGKIAIVLKDAREMRAE